MRLVVERASGETVKGVVGAQEAEITTIGDQAVRLRRYQTARPFGREILTPFRRSDESARLQIRYVLERLPERQTGK